MTDGDKEVWKFWRSKCMTKGLCAILRIVLCLWGSLARKSRINCSQPRSPVHGILQARILEWAAISFSRRSSQARDLNCVSCIEDFSLLTESPGKPRQTQNHFLLLTDYLVTSRYLLHIFCKNLIKFLITIRTLVVCRFMPCIWCSFVLFLRCVSISFFIFILAMAFWNW